MKKIFITLISILLLLIGSYSFADTVLTAPDGKTIGYGMTEISCPLDPSNPTNEYTCLLMGSLNGIPVIAAENQSDPAVVNKLYMVKLLNSTSADYGFLSQNIITVQGNSLSNYIRSNQYAYFSNYSGQLCQWTDKDTKTNYLLMTNQYSQGFGVFSITPPDPDKGILGYTASFVKTVALPPPAKYITDLDVIDLNAYSTHTNKALILPRALIIACKQDNQTGHDNLQFNLPTHLYVCNFEGLNLSVTQDFQLPYSPNTSGFFSRFGSQTSFSWNDVMHGFMVSAKNTGELSYIIATSNGSAYSNCTWTESLSETNYYIWGYALPIQVDNQNRITLSGGISTNYRVFGYNYTTSTKNFQDIPSLYKQANLMWLGLTIGVDNSSNVGIYPVPPAYHLSSTDQLLQIDIGKMNYLTPDQLQGMQYNGVGPDFGPSPTDQQKIESYLISKGTQVYAVMYGWPYFAWPNSQIQSLTTFPSYTQTNAKTNFQSTQVGNGVSMDSETGAQGKDNIDGVQLAASIGLKTTFDYTQTKGQAQTSSLSTAETIQKSDMSDTDYVDDGVIFYVESNPSIVSYGWIVPTNGPVHVDGINNEQFVIVTMAGGSAPTTGLMISQFDVTNPSRLLVPQWTEVVPNNTYSALSDGLTAKPEGSLLLWDKSSDIHTISLDIRNWQTSAGLDDLINRATADKSTRAGWGVTPYYGSNKGINYNLSTSTEIDGSSALSNTNAITTSFGLGITWSFKATIAAFGMYNKGSLMYKRSTSFVNTDTTSSGFQLKIPNDNLAPSTNYQVWVLYINVPMLKTALAVSGQGLQKPPYIPNWCWEYNQSFMLILPYVPENFGNENC